MSQGQGVFRKFMHHGGRAAALHGAGGGDAFGDTCRLQRVACEQGLSILFLCRVGINSKSAG